MNPTSDPPSGAAAAVQQEILAALRAGESFRTAHKEGGMVISFQQGRFLRQDYGDWDTREEFTGDEAFLIFLRRFFEWESRGGKQGEVSEEERWRNIQRLLRRDGTRRVLVNGASPLMVVAAFVLAAVAVTLVFWLRGRLPGSDAPQKLDSFNGTPPKVPEFRH